MIPVAHGSAGPLLDIVVPFDGQITGNTLFTHRLQTSILTNSLFVSGYHATTPEGFAEAIHTVLTLPPAEGLAKGPGT